MLKSRKLEFVSELESVYQASSSVIVTHYHGLTVSEITSLRKKLRENGANFKVVKNTLSKIATKTNDKSDIAELFSGPSAIAYSEDPTIAAKLVVEFANSNDKLKIIGGIVNQQVLDLEGVKLIAKLPSLNELRGKIVGVLQAPAAKLVGVLQAPASQLARVISAYSDKK
ncbi:MAG: ribosomal protein [Rickettsiaceae bacterium]|jgi:large subunit ribosomal protein L10|nr:ribosomal protein [Rickettsiaceae bacterium]